MAQVELQIGGRGYTVACRDGEEAELEALGRKLDTYSATAIRASGAPAGERVMLFIALMLADELAELQRSGSSAENSATPAILGEIADRLEAVASALEESAPSA